MWIFQISGGLTVGSGETLYISIVSQAITGNSTSAINITAVLNMDTAYTNAADRPDPKAVGLGDGNLLCMLLQQD